jgi:hypothetical protein
VELFLCFLPDTLRTTLILPLVQVFVSVLKYALSNKDSSVQVLGYGPDGLGFEFRYRQEISSPKRLPGGGGYFLEV